MTATATATRVPTVVELAGQWNDTASAFELEQVAKTARAFATSHGTGILTTEELRSVYRSYVQEGTAKRNGMFFALAVAVQQAAQVPYGSLSSWARKQERAAAVCTGCGRKGTKKSPLLHGRHGYSHNGCDR